MLLHEQYPSPLLIHFAFEIGRQGELAPPGNSPCFLRALIGIILAPLKFSSLHYLLQSNYYLHYFKLDCYYVKKVFAGGSQRVGIFGSLFEELCIIITNCNFTIL